MDANSRKPNPHGVAAEPDAREDLGRRRSRRSCSSGAAVVGAILTYLLFRHIEKSAAKKDEASIAAAGMERREVAAPPLPRLQV